MAFSEVITEVRGNPSRLGRPKAKRKKPMAKRKLTDKQIKHFGTARQRANLARRKAAGRKSSATRRTAKRPKQMSHRKRTVSNPVPEAIVLTLGNPSTRRGKAMAKPKHKGGAKAHRGNPARRGGSKKKMMFHSRRARRHNPAGLGSPMDWLTGGAGVLTGVVGTRALPQLVLGANNTGFVGYFANAVSAAGLGLLSHVVFPRNRVLTPAVVAGGFAALIARIIGDYTTYGQYLSLTGVGDYMVSNAVAPQRLVNPGSAMVEVPNGWGSAPPAMAISSSGVDSTDASSAAMGIDVGRRGGYC